MALDTSFDQNTLAVILYSCCVSILTNVLKRLNLGISDIWNLNETDTDIVQKLDTIVGCRGLR